MSDYFERFKKIKLGELPKEAVPKKKKPLKKVSDKRRKELDAEKRNGYNGLDAFFERNRGKLVGVCQCGCGQPSQKKDDTFYRGSICHIFPKAIFKSVATNDYNFVERAIFGGCHSNMDNLSIDRWVNFADFDDIKEKIRILIPFIPEGERKHKLFKTIQSLLYKK